MSFKSSNIKNADIISNYIWKLRIENQKNGLKLLEI